MPISESTLSRWSHHQAGTAFKEAHAPIREALTAYNAIGRLSSIESGPSDEPAARGLTAHDFQDPSSPERGCTAFQALASRRTTRATSPALQGLQSG